MKIQNFILQKTQENEDTTDWKKIFAKYIH